MITLTVTDREGKTHAVKTTPDGTLMEAIRDYGLTDGFALCGGHCSCATCHVILDEAVLSLLSPVSDDEDGLLDGSDHREAGSRLACQVPLTAKLDLADVKIAPAD
ncbi:2Fe-2S iron-sulfur cluster-binding protein [Aurantiacibacter suaedae]|uniref:2Fe-2S iron-sulfur cluster-binding protein n=1 Tax=Aurantiacibacter suaedae TaxID=2545755 RepID=UPI0010F4D589|nr:2Fe-2S iron-sulfur cluster-binding protein [Aurantiacibacter suaedae]